jgi:hypothetical protein
MPQSMGIEAEKELDIFAICEIIGYGEADRQSGRRMHVISKKRLREFWERSPEAETPLCAWYRVAEHATWEKFADIRRRLYRV